MGHGEAYVFGGAYRRLRQKDLPSKTLSGTVYLGGTAHNWKEANQAWKR